MSDNDVMNEENKIYLGGYLVCLLVDIRSNSTPSAGLYADWLSEKLKGALTQVFDADDQRSQIGALERADRILSRIDDLLDHMEPTKYGEFLSPIYEKRDVLFAEKDQKLLELLEMFCNLNSLSRSKKWPLEVALGWNWMGLWLHDIHDLLRQIGGFLFSLRNVINNQDKTHAVAIRVDAERKKGIYDVVAKLPFSYGDFRANLMPLQLIIWSAYSNTEFHAKAESLMREKVQKAISDSPGSELIIHGDLLTQILLEYVNGIVPPGSDLMREMFWKTVEFDSEFEIGKDLLLQMFNNTEAYFSSLTNEPHISPWIRLLKLVVRNELGEHSLLNDEFVVQLKNRIEAL